ncbi:MAG: long-chain fatty acid--CoA ligase, partial [Pseudomonadales bacterium]|nr:long-chain fatty acid--CoA ligase [Pseudomonadales bacterium]
DADGYLYLTDRASHMIITGGVNVYPREVEDVLLSHPAIQDAAVFAVPDEEFGEAVKAAIEPVPGITVTAEEIIGFCRARIAHLKCPRSIDFHDALPRHQTGKLYKEALKAPYWPASTSG